MKLFKHILLSRTDSIGDVVLTLPMAGYLKSRFPGIKISFLGKTYTKPVISASKYIDEFIDWDEISKIDEASRIEYLKQRNIDVVIHVFPKSNIATLAKKAKIPCRIGTSHRVFHWWTCNYMVHVGRKNSDLHESQLNLQLLKPLGVSVDVKREEIRNFYGFELIPAWDGSGVNLSSTKKNIILHPKSKGSAMEWGLDNFSKLIELLPEDEFSIYITGTSQEAELMQSFLEKHLNRVVDLTGKFTLDQMIAFISKADVLVAASTGVLHIAAALGKKAIGLYSPNRPIFPQRWAPLGEQSLFLVEESNGKLQDENILNIAAEEVRNKILEH